MAPVTQIFARCPGLLAALIGIFGLAAASARAATYVTRDGQIQLDLPDRFKLQDPIDTKALVGRAANFQEVFSARDEANQQFISFFATRKTDTQAKTLSDFAGVKIARDKQAGVNASDPSETKLGDPQLPALRSLGHKRVNNTDLTMVSIFIETPDAYEQLFFMCPSDAENQGMQDLLTIASSIRHAEKPSDEQSGNARPNQAGGAHTVTYTTADEQLDLGIPDNFARLKQAHESIVFDGIDRQTGIWMRCSTANPQLLKQMSLEDFAKQQLAVFTTHGEKFSPLQARTLADGLTAIDTQARFQFNGKERHTRFLVIRGPKSYLVLMLSCAAEQEIDASRLWDTIVTHIRKHDPMTARQPTTLPTHVWKTPNDLMKLTLDDGWEPWDASPNKDGIRAQNEAMQATLTADAAAHDKVAFGLVENARICRQRSISTLTDGKAGDVEQADMGAYRVLRFVAEGKSGGKDVMLLTVVFDTAKSRVIITLCGDVEKVKASKDQLTEIVKSVEDAQ